MAVVDIGKNFDVDHAEGFPSVWMNAKKKRRKGKWQRL